MGRPDQRRRCALLCAIALVLLPATMISMPPTQATSAPWAGSDPSTVAPADRDLMLPSGWRGSADLAWITVGDSRGLHLMVAESRTGYTWRTLATLIEPGIEADSWVGNACLTGSGRRVVVVYAPRHFTNREHLFGRGAFAAVVDVADGRVVKLPIGVSIAYYNPGCGAGESAVLTQSGAADIGRTRLHVLDTARAAVVRWQEMQGQVTSAVPFGDGIAAAVGGRLIGISAGGTERTLATTTGVPAYLRPDRDDGLAFLERTDDRTAAVRYVNGDTVRELARGPLGGIGLAAGAGGQVFITGGPATVAALPDAIRRIAAPAHASISSLGQLELTETGHSGQVRLHAKIPATGKALNFQAVAGIRMASMIDTGHVRSPVFGSSAGLLPTGSPTDPVEADRTCAVSRNDVHSQVEQPHWNQVEWAADLAVQNALTVTRPQDFRQSGLPAWSPQTMFPTIGLAGGGRVPAQVLLGVLAQESNLWQASWHALEGVPGNPLIGNYYGVLNLWDIDWANADCGYGVAQVTDGMRLAAGGPTIQQRAIAIDYATNIAAGLRILQEKWNQTYAAGIRMNNVDPAKPENWFAAVWAYNSGVNPQAITGNTSGCTPSPTCTDGRGSWGLGWGNNPANPDHPFDRAPFLETSQNDAAHPERWPYPEKVMGWAAYPITKYDFRHPDEYDAGYQLAWWTTNAYRSAVKPPLWTFCGTEQNANNCGIDSRGAGSCGYPDFHCWWHLPATWKQDCDYTCGHENLAYLPGAAEPARGTHYPPVCSTTGLPGGSLIVDDVPSSIGVIRSDTCANPTATNGTFAFQFAGTPAGLYRSKRDLHQIGSGLNGHFWFSHAYNSADDAANTIQITGTWTLGRTLNQWARVFVHLPSHGAQTQQARYTVDRGATATPADTRFKTRTLGQYQGTNRWMSLGAFQFNGIPKVSLSNITGNQSDTGVEDVAWDAVAFQPLTAKPTNFVVALGDSHASGEGASEDARVDYYPDSAYDADGMAAYRNGCHRSRWVWSRQAFLRDDPNRDIGQRADAYDPTMDYHLLACSGSLTENLLPSSGDDPETDKPWANGFGWRARESYLSREPSQLDMGYLDENTTLVTLQIGGNDAKWVDVLQRCLAIPTPFPCMEFPINGQRMADYIPALIGREVRQSVTTVLRAIAQQAPAAKIILMGYPELMSHNGDCMQLVGNGITPIEAAWVNEQSRALAWAQAQAVQIAAQAGVRVHFADPIINGDFGDATVCGDPETFHRIIMDKVSGEDPNPTKQPISQQSLHPKISGAARYTITLDRELRNWGL